MNPKLSDVTSCISKSRIEELSVDGETSAERYDTPDRALKPAEVARLSGFSVKTLSHWRISGRGPPFRKVNGRVRYMLSSTLEWLESHKERRSTSDTTAATGPSTPV